INVKICLSKDSNEIKFSVNDSGIGIKQEQQKNIFKQFNKPSLIERRSGSGLGLFIVKELTSKIGKSIDFISFLDKGSMFYFSIPFVKPKLKPKKRLSTLAEI